MTERAKPRYKIWKAEIVRAESYWPNDIHYEGKFVARGYMNTELIGDTRRIGRTSLLVNINIEQGYVETLDSIYEIQ